MKTRVPRRYRGLVRERVFFREILPAAGSSRDRTFLEEAYRRDSRGRYHLREELSAAELDRLAAILRGARGRRRRAPARSAGTRGGRGGHGAGTRGGRSGLLRRFSRLFRRQ